MSSSVLSSARSDSGQKTVQRRATKMVLELKYLSQSEKIRRSGLETLEARFQRRDMIQDFQFDINTNHLSWMTDQLTNLKQTGEQHQRAQSKTHKELSYFTNRILNNWNALSPEVISAQSFNTFKNRYNRYMNNLEKIMTIEPGLTNESIIIPVHLFFFNF